MWAFIPAPSTILRSAVARRPAAALFTPPVRALSRGRSPPPRHLTACSADGASVIADVEPKLSTSTAPPPPTPILTFQDAILKLQHYWASRGCILWHPYNTEVGAGTMNPATFLRVLGPEPWAVAYDEPSVRPDDSRYGENPNRVQRHTQFQVIMKPAPENPQELLLGSYAALGIDTAAHDIRFVEDNWESPALGAWGLGWEVWLDGMEITQFTYFQQAGGVPLDKVAVEITYGLERILMSLQGKTHFKDIDFAPGISYGEIFMQNEVEMSRYNLDEADVARNTSMFDIYEKEALDMLSKRLPIPAYNYLLKASHTFNVLDARGAVGVTERARFFQRMRQLSRDVAKLWLERREELEHPLLRDEEQPVAPSSAAVDVGDAAATFLLEIGTEELPAGVVDSAADQLGSMLRGMLETYELGHDGLHVDATPRRLVVTVGNLVARQEDKEKEARGPPKKACFDKKGNSSKAALGFCRSQGVQMEDVFYKPDDKGTEYLYAKVRIVGLTVTEILSKEVPQILAKLSFGRTMRWNSTDVAFSRPVRWMVALYGDTVVPLSFAGVRSDRFTKGMRIAGGDAPTVSVPNSLSYKSVMGDLGIMVNRAERKDAVLRGVLTAANEVGGKVPDNFVRTDDDDSLLSEVTNLLEDPQPIRGEFDAAFLSLPQEVLVTVMKKHQRYFPVIDGHGRLLNSFVTVGNGKVANDVVRAGNEAVLRARYADAAFFYDKDKGRPLSDFTPSLAGLTFQEKLGSMLDKKLRLEKIAPAIAKKLSLRDEDCSVLAEATALCKSDLTTAMVVEFTGLAGHMGRHYARTSGSSDQVADVIFEHVLPRSSGDELPVSGPGITLAVSDRLDSLVGLFAVGLAPKATADPFALRRAALGVVQTLAVQGITLDLREAVDIVASAQPVEVTNDVKQAVIEFAARRMEAWLLENSANRFDVVRAVLAAQGSNPAMAVQTINTLQELYNTAEFDSALDAQGRAMRLVRSKLDQISGAAVDPSLFEVEEEKELFEAYEAAIQAMGSAPDVAAVISSLAGMKTVVDRFFDNVFVMSDDPAVRQNRLTLSAKVADLTAPFFESSEIQKL